ncbi:hypothetical protein Rs2_38565 [Raphanus sativus]|nr:hypothetical protein Rs2_38565 [Raphanus sativus]
MGHKRSWSDTSEDPATQRRKATYTQEEVDKMISDLYTALEDAEEDYTRQFDAVYVSFNDNFDTLYPRTERLVKDITDIWRQLATQPSTWKSTDMKPHMSLDTTAQTPIDYETVASINTATPSDQHEPTMVALHSMQEELI